MKLNKINKIKKDKKTKTYTYVKLAVNVKAHYFMHPLEENEDDVKNFVGSVLENNNVYAKPNDIEVTRIE